MNRRLLVFCLFLFLTHSQYAQLSPATAVAEMGRGINLGNTLEPPSEGAWNNGPAQEALFDAYVAAGFTNVRIPVRWDEHTADTAPYAIDAEWLDRVEEVVDWGLERDLYVTLNGHHEDWLKANYGDPAERARYDAIWVQISERFQDKSDKLLFEIINEPFGMTVAEVDELNERILGIIREDDPTRLVIFGGNQYANAEELLLATVPDDDYVIGYFHSYDPWSFAGEGIGTWGTEADYAALDEKFSRVAMWSQTNEVPVHLSEFGAVRQADYNSRMRYYAAYVEAALRYGFAFSVWDDGGMFGVLDRESRTWPEVKDILIYTYADSPTDLLLSQPEPIDTLDPEVNLSWRNRATADSVRVERRIDEDAFVEIASLAPSAESYRDTTVQTGNTYTYRIVTHRADGTLLHSYPAQTFVGILPEEPAGDGIVNYADGLDTAATRFSGEPAGITYALANGVLTVAGDGTSPTYQTFRYTLPDSLAADAVASNDLLYISARSLSGEAVNLRIDLIDENDRHTTNAGRSVSISGTEFAEYRLDYNNGYQDGGYGGTGCPAADAPCAVNGARIVALAFYPEANDGGFNDTIQIDYLSFGQPLDENAEPTGLVGYQDDLEGAGAQFQGEPAGLSYSVVEGVLAIVGDGSAPAYQTVTYELHDENDDPVLADAVNSDNLLYLRARTASGEPTELRIDLIDNNNFHTTLAGRTARIEGSSYQVYALDFAGGYQDGGYGGTACDADTQPCAVDGRRIARLAFYPDPASGGFADTLFLDWLSFGSELTTSLRVPESFSELAVYPNPTHDRITVTYRQRRAGEIRTEVMDGLGRRVFSQRRGMQAAGNNSLPIDLSGIVAGTYYVRVSFIDGSGSSTIPVLIR
ncbi:putative secreted protein (Por secretion system target) [Neolewinella xylanilytica]|uniref:Putative secreted protein (Por secretion system target) n=1 Tax=Neolewinella xylanilytica TaxID=1514080 RepID=A0A2S6I4D3_9BACT|nr:cellulase family glycosylhydrolase [Neolewinella xylanilytica]PPK85919.1 putative secreted protein (Por secretion system target) [Neolewinella xylanilytica]